MTQSIVLAAHTEQSLAVANTPNVELEIDHRDAFSWALAASKALPAAKLAPLNVDLRNAIVTARGALPKILSYRAQLATLPGFDLTDVDTLAWHIKAITQAEVLYESACRGPALVAALAKQARARRALLLSDLRMMVTFGRFPATQLQHLKRSATTHVQQAFGLMEVVNAYRKHSATLDGHSYLKQADVDEASLLADQFLDAYASRHNRDAELTAANDQRRRNFTLLAHAYDQVRRGLSYLLWNEGSLEQVAPSLYRGRGGSRRKEHRATAEPKAAP